MADIPTKSLTRVRVGAATEADTGKPPDTKAVVKTIGRALERVQSNIDEATRPARQNPLNQSVTVQKVVIPVAPEKITFSHGLGRAPKGYSVVKVSTDGGGGAAPAYTEDSSGAREITLQGMGPAATTVDLLVH